MAAAPASAWILPVEDLSRNSNRPFSAPQKPSKHLDFPRVFRGHELTRKDRRLSSGLNPLDSLIGGGIARGRISEIIGRTGTGRSSIAAAFAASATRRGEAAAWIDSSGAFDPESIAASGVDLRRMLWASVAASPMARASGARCARLDARALHPLLDPPPYQSLAGCASLACLSTSGETQPKDAAPPQLFDSGEGYAARKTSALLKAAELILEAGGFGLVVIDFGAFARAIPESAALRLARAAERCDAAVVAIASTRVCGTFAAISLVLRRAESSFDRLAPGAPAMFDELTIDATVVRNKLGGSGGNALVHAAIDPSSQLSLFDSDVSAPARDKLSNEKSQAKACATKQPQA